MNIVKKILNYSFWLLVGNSIGRLAMFLANIFAARMMSQEVFGQFTMVRSTISILEGIISGVIGLTTIKTIAVTAHNNKSQLTLLISSLFFVNLLSAGVLMILIVLFSSLIVDTFFMASETMVCALKIGAFLLLATTLSTMTQSILIGLEEFKKLAFLGIIVSVISIPFIWLFIYYFGLYGALFGVANYFLLDFSLKIYYLHKKIGKMHIRFSFQDIIRQSKEIVIFSFPLFLSVIMISISFWYARVLLINYTNSFGDIAVFDAAFQWLTIIMILTGATTSVALPLLSKAFGEKDEENFLKIFYVNLNINIFISIFIATIFIVFSKNIMSLYGEQYIKGYDILYILAVTSVFFSISSIFNKFMISNKHTWSIPVISFISILILFIVLLVTKEEKGISLAFGFLAYYGSSSFTYFLYFLHIQRKKVITL